jgi:hypothetical protein
VSTPSGGLSPARHLSRANLTVRDNCFIAAVSYDPRAPGGSQQHPLGCSRVPICDHLVPRTDVSQFRRPKEPLA